MQKLEETVDEFYLQYFSTKKNWAVMLIHVYTFQHLSVLKCLFIVKYLYKTVKNFSIYNFFKKMKSSFLCHTCQTDSYPPTHLPLTLLVTNSNHKTQTYCLNKLS